MTVTKYASQFTLLSGYAQHMVASEQMRAEQFQEGLRLNIRAQVAPFMLRTYSEVVARALIIEREQLEVQKERNKNSRFGDFRSRDKRAKRPRMNGPRQLPMQQGQASGSTVGDMGPRTCYECGATGHLRRWCPKLQQQNTQPPQGQFRPVNHSRVQGGQPPRGGDPKKGKTASTSGQGSQSRVFAMAARDPEPSVLVEGMVLCYSTWAHVLFDLGASRSFMSTSFASILDLEIAPLSCPLFVETPMGGVMEAKWGCSGCVLNVGGYEVVIDLVLLRMTVFDVIV